MVTKKKEVNWGDAKKCGRLRIEAETVISYIENEWPISGASISAENGQYKFSDIDDIKKNKDLFEGFPEVRIGSTTLKFKANSFGIKQHSFPDKHELDEAELDAVFSYFKKFRDPLHFLFSLAKSYAWMLPVIAVLFLMFWLSSSDSVKEAVTDYYDNSTYGVIIVSLTTIVLCLAHFAEDKRSSVFHMRRRNFFVRNIDTVAVSTITLVIGLIMGRFF